MPENQYLILLRGINVGGNNIIKMADLKISLTNAGFSEVKTYIQSGNVILQSSLTKANTLMKVEQYLAKDFSYSGLVFIFTKKELKHAIDEAPKGFGAKPEKFRYDVIFLEEQLSANQALQEIQTRDGVDTVHAGGKALYFSRLKGKEAQSFLSKIIKLPLYKHTTIRNWNTITKLMEMMKN